MIAALCREYGKPLGQVNGEKFFSFPSVATLATANEARLRDLGFGYRAKFIPVAAQQVLAKGDKAWLEALRYHVTFVCLFELTEWLQNESFRRTCETIADGAAWSGSESSRLCCA